MKGISPLIAAVLLIAFTVAIATLISGWFTGFAQKTTGAITNKTNLAVDCSSAGINIKEVFVKSGATGTVRAFVENNGFLDGLSISGAVVYNSTGQAVVADALPTSGLNRGQSVVLTFSSVAISSCPANFDRVVVSTDCGGISSTFSGTPKCE